MQLFFPQKLLNQQNFICFFESLQNIEEKDERKTAPGLECF